MKLAINLAVSLVRGSFLFTFIIARSERRHIDVFHIHDEKKIPFPSTLVGLRIQRLLSIYKLVKNTT